MDKRNLREYWIHGLILFMFRVFKFNRGGLDENRHFHGYLLAGR